MYILEILWNWVKQKQLQDNQQRTKQTSTMKLKRKKVKWNNQSLHTRHDNDITNTKIAINIEILY